MLHGDIHWGKQQEIRDKMLREGKTEAVVIDTEAEYMYQYNYSYVSPSHYRAHAALVDAFTMGMGFGKGMQAKRKMVSDRKVVAAINKRHPALAAEQRVGGTKAERSIALELKRLRDWKNLNWGFYYGRGAYDENPLKGKRFIGISELDER